MKPIGLVARDTGPLLGFELMKEARKFKAALKRLTADDSQYYSCLARYELGHFDQITQVALEQKIEPAVLAKRVLAGLQQELNAAEWAASEEAPVDPKGKKKVKLFLGFQSAEAFEEIRSHLKILAGDDSEFTRIMLEHGFESADKIPNHEAGIKVYKALCARRNEIQLDRETIRAASQHVGPERAKELMQVLRDAYDTLGAGVFFMVLDKHGAPTIDEAVRSYNLPLIMTELLRESERRKALASGK